MGVRGATLIRHVRGVAGGTAFVAAGELNWSGDALEALGATGQFDGVWLEGAFAAWFAGRGHLDSRATSLSPTTAAAAGDDQGSTARWASARW